MSNEIRIALISLGCDKNLTDSETMLGLLNEDGYALTAQQSAADVIIINTCGFIAAAAEESRAAIAEAAALKNKGGLKALIVTGCMAERYREALFDEFPVDAVVGVGEYPRIREILRDCLQGEDGGGKRLYVGSAGVFDEDALAKRAASTPRHYAYLKIAEGCDNRCTYCTIPSIRGPYRSRRLEHLAAEGRRLAESGVQELILVAQDTALYGTDIYGEPSLHILLRELSAIGGIEWIRLLYCYPEHIYDGLIAEMAANPKVLHYIDMPVQHASDRILRLMNRRFSSEGLREVIARLRAAMPDIALRTTLIAGFPGEDQDDFQRLLDFVRETGFDRLGVFAYSREDGTPAARLPGQLDERTKAWRRDKLMTVQQGISAKRLHRLKGKRLTVLADGRLEDGQDRGFFGRSYADSPDIDGAVLFSCPKGAPEPRAGDFCRVRVTGSTEYDLIGEMEIVEYGE